MTERAAPNACKYCGKTFALLLDCVNHEKLCRIGGQLPTHKQNYPSVAEPNGIRKDSQIHKAAEGGPTGWSNAHIGAAAHYQPVASQPGPSSRSISHGWGAAAPIQQANAPQMTPPLIPLVRGS